MKSPSAILKKVIRDRIDALITATTLPTGRTQIKGGEPTPITGGERINYTVHNCTVKNVTPLGGNYYQETYSVQITVSLHASDVPTDRYFEGIESVSDGLDALVNIIKEDFLDNEFNLCASATTLFDGDSPFICGIRMQPTVGPVERKEPDWWGARKETDYKHVQPNSYASEGYIKTLTLSGWSRYTASS